MEFAYFCSYCRKQAHDPINLICTHNLCYLCAQQIHVVDNQSLIQHKFAIQCPDCRKITLTYNIQNLLIQPWSDNDEDEENQFSQTPDKILSYSNYFPSNSGKKQSNGDQQKQIKEAQGEYQEQLQYSGRPISGYSNNNNDYYEEKLDIQNIKQMQQQQLRQQQIQFNSKQQQPFKEQKIQDSNYRQHQHIQSNPQQKYNNNQNSQKLQQKQHQNQDLNNIMVPQNSLEIHNHQQPQHQVQLLHQQGQYQYSDEQGCNLKTIEIELKCQIHQEPLQFYCNDDGEVLCIECIQKSNLHKNHIVMPLKTALKQIRKQNQWFQSETNNKIESIEAAIEILNSKKGDLEASFINVGQKMQIEIKEIVDLIKKRESSLKSTLKSIYEQKLQEFDKQINDLVRLRQVLGEYKNINENNNNSDDYSSLNWEVFAFTTFALMKKQIDDLMLHEHPVYLDNTLIIDVQKKNTIRQALDQFIKIDLQKIEDTISDFKNSSQSTQIKNKSFSNSNTNSNYKKDKENEEYKNIENLIMKQQEQAQNQFIQEFSDKKQNSHSNNGVCGSNNQNKLNHSIKVGNLSSNDPQIWSSEEKKKIHKYSHIDEKNSANKQSQSQTHSRKNSIDNNNNNNNNFKNNTNNLFFNKIPSRKTPITERKIQQ